MTQITNPYLSDHTGEEIDESVHETQALQRTIAAAVAPLATKTALAETNTALEAEKTRAKGAESNLSNTKADKLALEAEETRAKGAESNLSNTKADKLALEAEETRAKGAEKTLDDKLKVVEENVSSTLSAFSTEQQQKIEEFQTSINEQIAEQDANIKQQIKEQNENVDNKLKDTEEQLVTLGSKQDELESEINSSNLAVVKMWVTEGQQILRQIDCNLKKGNVYTFSVDRKDSISAVTILKQSFESLFDVVDSYDFVPQEDYSSLWAMVTAEQALHTSSEEVVVTVTRAGLANDVESLKMRTMTLESNMNEVETQMGANYTEVQSSVAEFHFNNLLNGFVGYAKVSTKFGSLAAANVLNNYEDTGYILKDFSAIDLTGMDGTTLYIECDVNDEVYLELIASSALIDTIVSTNNKIDNLSNRKMIPVTVKKDGTGDFTTIQEAINSIKDASATKQYDVQVYDDYDIQDLEELWMLQYPNTHVEAAPSAQCALFITKDYVNVRGVGRMKTLYVHSRHLDLPAYSFPNIQVIIPQGNCTIKNFHVKLAGGRYAIHQESSGVKNHLDVNATTVLEDMIIEHEGNSAYQFNTWVAVEGQANGTASGSNWIYRNCKWISHEAGCAYYSHTNYDFSEPSTLLFENCSVVPYVPRKMATSCDDIFVTDAGSKVGAKVKMTGCNFNGFGAFSFGKIRGLEESLVADNILDGAIDFEGHGNTVQIINARENPSLSFKSVATNVPISVVGGTAYDAIWGSTYKTFGGEALQGLSNAVCVGSNKIYDKDTTLDVGESATSVYSLAYRLGNCAASPKTLVVKVGNTEHTISFNKNYMPDGYIWNTTPKFSNDEIVADINNQFGDVFIAAVGGWTELKAPNDCMCECIVHANYNIQVGTIVSRLPLYGGGSRTIVPCLDESLTHSLMGVICESTNALCRCSVALLDKSYFPKSLLMPNTTIEEGDLFTVSGGILTATNDKSKAVMIAIDSETLAKYVK